MHKAISAGLGLPGTTIVLALLRQGWKLIAADPKPVTARTTERVYGPTDVGKPKVLALQQQAAALGRLDQLSARCGRIEDVVGGQEWREAKLIVLATDRPATTRRVTEICLRLATPNHPLPLLTCHVSEGAAQVRSFLFPLAAGPCPLCGSGEAFISSLLNEDGFSCEQAVAEGGDAFTMPYGAAEGHAAAALALSAIGAPAGVDTTLALGPVCEAFASRLTRDPHCLLDCARVPPWPEATLTLGATEPILPVLAAVARDAGIAQGTARLESLRPLALGSECACGRRPYPRVFRNPCPHCQSPVVALEGWTTELAPEQLPPDTSATSLGLPARDLLLLRGQGRASSQPQAAVTIAVEGQVQDD